MNEEKQAYLRRFAHQSVLHWRRGDLNFIPGSTLQSRVRAIKIDEAVQSVVDCIRTLVLDIKEAGFSFGDDEFYVGGVETGYLLTNRRLFVYADKKNNNTIVVFSLKDITRVDARTGWTAQLIIETKDGRVVEYKKLGGVPDHIELYALRDFDWQKVSFEESSFAVATVASEDVTPDPGEKEGGDSDSDQEPWNVKAGIVVGGLIAFGFSYVVVPLLIRSEALGLDAREAFFSFAGMCALMTIGPAILRVFGLKSWFIIWVLVLSYARVYQSDRSVFLTPVGVSVFCGLTYGSYAVFSNLAVDWLKKGNKG